jgi:uncharacterized protein (DUF2147 family)
LKPESAENLGTPIGVWLTEAGDAKVRISQCGTGLCGIIVWLKNPIDTSTGKPQVDDKNANRSLANRPIVGINIFNQMNPAQDNKWCGRIYNADDGKTYSSEVRLSGAKKLEVRGCVMALLCGGETWTRIGDMTLVSAQGQ